MKFPRHTIVHDYHDYSTVSEDMLQKEEAFSIGSGKLRDQPNKRNQSNNNKDAFPVKLHRILMNEDYKQEQQPGRDEILCWMPHGRAFIVKDTDAFVEKLMPLYFKQTKWTSFQRQLNLYGFNRLTKKGPDNGAYYHEKFLRGSVYSQLCLTIARKKVKGTGIKGANNPNEEPDFYKMPPLVEKFKPKVKKCKIKRKEHPFETEPIKVAMTENSQQMSGNCVAPVTPLILPVDSCNARQKLTEKCRKKSTPVTPRSDTFHDKRLESMTEELAQNIPLLFLPPPSNMKVLSNSKHEMKSLIAVNEAEQEKKERNLITEKKLDSWSAFARSFQEQFKHQTYAATEANVLDDEMRQQALHMWDNVGYDYRFDPLFELQ